MQPSRKQYSVVGVAQGAEGFTITLDNSVARTPWGKPLILPTLELADAIAKEFSDQGEVLDANTMILMRLACIASDIVSAHHDEVVDDILAYAETDLLCYRSGDEELQKLQAEAWDPILQWVKERYQVHFTIAAGVMPVEQSPEALGKLKTAIKNYTDWQLAAMALMVKASGSFLLALAVMEGQLDATTATQLSQMDEAFQAAHWGEDEEQSKRLEALAIDMQAAAIFNSMLQ